MRPLRQKLSFANVTSALALFVAVGGVAWAVQIAPKNSVVSRSIKSGQVKTSDLADRAVTNAKLACKGNSAVDKMVRVGSVCIDKYEASVWSSPTGGTQYGLGSDDYPCDDNGQDCEGKIFARSVAGEVASRYITWFQAQQALANSGKRLPTNAEWQMAVAGTPDSTVCNTALGFVVNTGSLAGCVSSYGAHDMVGNLWEWVADWDEQADPCAAWPAGFGEDVTCIGRGSGQASTAFPGALFRGGSFINITAAGPFAVAGENRPSYSNNDVGFRGAR